MSEEKFDAIVIGAGQSGPSLTAALASKGKSRHHIERKYFGGTCINNGCIPSKTYVRTLKSFILSAMLKVWGQRSNFSIDLKKSKQKKDLF